MRNTLKKIRNTLKPFLCQTNFELKSKKRKENCNREYVRICEKMIMK